MLKIDPGTQTPPFEQLREQIVAQIVSGALAPGAKLPPVRKLAVDLGLAANTVARTYRELEASGFVRTQGRNGTVVTPNLAAPAAHERALLLTREYLAAMAAIGIDPARIPEYLERAETP